MTNICVIMAQYLNHNVCYHNDPPVILVYYVAVGLVSIALED